jgi:hypothetical protein
MIRALDRFYAKHPRSALCIAVLIAGICLGVSRTVDDANAASSRQQVQTQNSVDRFRGTIVIRHPAGGGLSIFTQTTWPWVMF